MEGDGWGAFFVVMILAGYAWMRAWLAKDHSGGSRREPRRRTVPGLPGRTDHYTLPKEVDRP